MNMKEDLAVRLMLDELSRAEKIHPGWPTDIVHAAAILSEESGEAVQAALNVYYHSGDINEFRKELIHTGAMVIRCLKNLGD